MQSMEALDITSLRPDIKAAEDAKTAIKSKLGYRDEEELDTGVQKVQPLPFLDEEIQKYHAQIKESMGPAQEVNDTIPTEVLQRVDRAIALATEGLTSLFKASQLLEFTFDAYQYARGAARDQFDLRRASEVHLSRFEETFKNMIGHRVNADLTQAELEMVKCKRELESALEESRRDIRAQEARAGEEDAVIQNTSLQESHEQVQEMVRMEKSELNLIGDQCLKDMRTIDEELAQLQQRRTKAEQQYRQHDSKRVKTLSENRAEQRELEERLRVLREEEGRLAREGETGEQLQQRAKEAYGSTEREILEWREKIAQLKTRTETSLDVTGCMEECTDMIMVDAKGRKAAWKKRLERLAVESHWVLREGLLIKGAAYMMVLEDNKSNASNSKKLIAHYQNEKMQAARSGFAPRVDEAKRSIEQYTAARAEYEQKIGESSETMKLIREELVTLDAKLHALRPGLKLDTLENRYEDLHQKKEQAFDASGTEGMTFSFYHRLPR
jgi:hypothetical protein